MNTLMVSIPSGSVTLDFFYLPYKLSEGFINQKGSVTMKASDNVGTFRQKILEKYNINVGDYSVCKVSENEFQRYYSSV
jgi:hypothetical protein